MKYNKKIYLIDRKFVSELFPRDTKLKPNILFILNGVGEVTAYPYIAQNQFTETVTMKSNALIGDKKLSWVLEHNYKDKLEIRSHNVDELTNTYLRDIANNTFTGIALESVLNSIV